MKCNLENREDLINKYLMNELSDEESLHFEEHYFTCKDCFEELKALEQSLALVSKEGKTAFDSEIQKSKRNIFSLIPTFSTPLKIGFAFASLILLFVLYSALFNTQNKQKDDQQIISQQKDKIENKIDSSETKSDNPISKKKNLIAELSGPDFNPSPYYEEWINENVRSGNILIEKVISPKNNDKYLNQSALFKWRMTENVPVNLVIMDNDEDVIFSTKVTSHSFPEFSLSVKQNEFKKSGLYYWRIEDDNEVLYLGKFYFVRGQ